MAELWFCIDPDDGVDTGTVGFSSKAAAEAAPFQTWNYVLGLTLSGNNTNHFLQKRGTLAAGDTFTVPVTGSATNKQYYGDYGDLSDPLPIIDGEDVDAPGLNANGKAFLDIRYLKFIRCGGAAACRLNGTATRGPDGCYVLGVEAEDCTGDAVRFTDDGFSPPWAATAENCKATDIDGFGFEAQGNGTVLFKKCISIRANRSGAGNFWGLHSQGHVEKYLGSDGTVVTGTTYQFTGLPSGMVIIEASYNNSTIGVKRFVSGGNFSSVAVGEFVQSGTSIRINPGQAISSGHEVRFASSHMKATFLQCEAYETVQPSGGTADGVGLGLDHFTKDGLIDRCKAKGNEGKAISCNDTENSRVLTCAVEGNGGGIGVQNGKGLHRVANNSILNNDTGVVLRSIGTIADSVANIELVANTIQGCTDTMDADADSGDWDEDGNVVYDFTTNDFVSAVVALVAPITFDEDGFLPMPNLRVGGSTSGEDFDLIGRDRTPLANKGGAGAIAFTDDQVDVNIFNPGSGALTIEFIHADTQVTVSEQVIAARSGIDSTSYYIKPLNGTQIKNHTGTLTIEAHKITGAADLALTSGTIKMFKPDNSLAGNGYTWTASHTDINGSITVTLKDGAGGTPLSTITLVDVQDGDDGDPGTPGEHSVFGSVVANNGLAWRQDTNNGAWVPSVTTTDLTCTFFRAAVAISTRVVRVTRDADGILSAALQGTPTGEATSHSLVGNNSAAVTVTFTHTGSGVKVAQGVLTVRGGEDGEDGDDAVRYYIKPINGTAIKNGVGSLTIEAHKVTGAADVLLSSGTIKMFNPGNAIIGNGYTATLDADDIAGSKTFTLKDGSGGTPLDTITLIDVTDGFDVVVASISPSNGLAWRRDVNGGAWAPSDSTTDLTCKFFRSGAQIAMRKVRVSLNTNTGNLTSAPVSNSGEDTDYDTIGENTSVLTVSFVHVDTQVGASETVLTVQGGSDALAMFVSQGTFVLTEEDGEVDLNLAKGQGVLMQGSVDRTTNAAWSVSNQVNCTATVNNTTAKGFYEITNTTAGTGSFKLNAVFNGVTLSVTITFTVLLSFVALSATVTSVVDETVANGSNHGPTIARCVARGGVPPYTFQWRRVSGSSQITPWSATSVNTEFASTGTNQSYTAQFVCDVTDQDDNTVTSSNQCAVTREHGFL